MENEDENRIYDFIGRQIFCGCGAHIATLTRNVYEGEQIQEEMFAADKGQGPWRNGEMMACRICGVGWTNRIGS